MGNLVLVQSAHGRAPRRGMYFGLIFLVVFSLFLALRIARPAMATTQATNSQSLPHHESRSEQMSREQKGARKEFWLARTKAECVDPATGKLLPGYLINDLRQNKRVAVERHLEVCEFCRVGALNWEELTAAVKVLGLPKDRRRPVVARV